MEEVFLRIPLPGEQDDGGERKWPLLTICSGLEGTKIGMVWGYVMAADNYEPGDWK